jgi:methionine-S-sulfoxide reductase
MRRWITIASLLAASLVLFRTTVAAADAPQKTPSPKKTPMTQPTSIHAPTNPASSVPAVPPAPQPAPGLETIYLAGGCFWGMEEILRKIPGVRETQAGYTGGWLPNPKYDDTHDSKSGHAESVKVVFDPKTLSLEELLEKWFFRMHDPTTLNRQGNDVGSQYRSAIFTFNETQKKTAETVKARVNASGKWRRPVVTEIATASIWYSAEGYHQKYLIKNPGGYTCHFMRD